jgi:predicted nucleic acid-binding protein
LNASGKPSTRSVEANADRAGVAIAQQQGFTVTGTLGVLDRAARHGLIDPTAAFDRLKATSFRYRSEMLDARKRYEHG